MNCPYRFRLQDVRCNSPHYEMIFAVFNEELANCCGQYLENCRDLPVAPHCPSDILKLHLSAPN